MNWEESFTKWVGSRQSLIVHTFLFIGAFLLVFLGAPLDTVLLCLTTVVSLEAIYLAIFIQMTVNRNTKSLEDVEHDIEEIQEDVEDIQEDVDEIQEDVEDIQEDVDEIQEDVEEIQEDVEEESAAVKGVSKSAVTLDAIHTSLQNLMADIEELKKKSK